MRIAADDARFVDALAYELEGAVAYFTTGEHRPGLPCKVGVKIDGGSLVFFPERSAAHRAILRAIGETV
jgi:hypothetical protein